MGILRFLLALAVLIQHGGPLFGLRLTGGPLAVQAFFIISGFYMTLILDGKYARLRSPYFVFIGNRLLRLFPAYLVIAALTVICFFAVRAVSGVEIATRFGGAVEWLKYSGGMSVGSMTALAATNGLMLGQDWLLFAAYDPATGALALVPRSLFAPVSAYRFQLVPQAWTLGIELTFYFLAPFLVKRRWWIVTLILAASLGLRAYTYFALGLTYDPWTYRFFPHELALFLAGCLGCKAYETWIARARWNVRGAGFAALGLMLAATLCYRALAFPNKHTTYLVLAALCIPPIFALTRNWRWDRNLGELSYPIYISHVLVLPYADLAAKKWAFVPLPVWLFIGTIALSVAIHLGLERRIDAIRQRRVARSGG